MRCTAVARKPQRCTGARCTPGCSYLQPRSGGMRRAWEGLQDLPQRFDQFVDVALVVVQVPIHACIACQELLSAYIACQEVLSRHSRPRYHSHCPHMDTACSHSHGHVRRDADGTATNRDVNVLLLELVADYWGDVCPASVTWLGFNTGVGLVFTWRAQPPCHADCAPGSAMGRCRSPAPAALA